MKKVLLLFVVLGLFATSCGGSGEGISINGEWARNSPMAADRGAVYMNIESADGDRLLAASVGSDIAGMTEVHETVPAEGDDSDDGMGMMTMQEVEAIDLPAGETVSLAPGGYHIMLMNLVQPLEVGQKFEVTLTFENYGEEVVEVEVMEAAPE